MYYLLEILSTIIMSGLLIIAIVQIHLFRKEMKANHDWNRRVTALNYSFSEQSEMRVIRSSVAKKLRLFERQPGEINLREIQELENSDPNIRGDLQYVLGRLAAMCAAINNNVVDEQVCKDLQGGSVVRYFRFFRQYIEDVRSLSKNPRVYECLEKYAIKWDQEKHTSVPQRKPTA